MFQRAGLFDKPTHQAYHRDHSALDLLQEQTLKSYEQRLALDVQQNSAHANRKTFDNPVELMLQDNPTDPMLHPELTRLDVRPKFIVRDLPFTSYRQVMAPTNPRQP